MPSRFEKYRMRDGLTKLGEAYFNPIFQDIDLRVTGLEGLRVAWEEAVRTVSAYGLVRINEVLGPSLVEAAEKTEEIEGKRLAAVAALSSLQSALTSVESSAAADIAAWKNARLAELEAWRDGLSGELPALDARLTALEEGGALSVVPYADRASLRGGTPAADEMVVVAGLGLFVFHVDSDEPDDDESCFATTNGRWLLEAAHWDLIDAWQTPDMDAAKPLFGTAVSAITSIAAGGQASFTGTVTGAVVGDRVVANPPGALSPLVACFARVTSANTVTIYLNNPSASTATLTTGTWQVIVLKEQ